MVINEAPVDFEERAEKIANRTGLSPTRSKVLVLIKLHKKIDEIADFLDISPRTVQNHIQDIRTELSNAEELLDIAGQSHYGDETLFKEFGGSLWMFRSGMTYEKNDDTTIEKKIYGSYHGACLLVEREITENQGQLIEERKRTEFYDGNDIPPHLFRKGQYDEYKIAVLHTAFIANAGIDPKYAPEELVSDEVYDIVSFDEMDEIVDYSDDWVSLSDG